MLNILRNSQTIFQSGCTVLQSHQQPMRVPIFPQPRHPLLPSAFLIRPILAGEKCYVMVLICISLLTSDVGHFFLCLLAFVYLLWRNVYSNLLPIFKLDYLFFIIELLKSFLSQTKCRLLKNSFKEKN